MSVNDVSTQFNQAKEPSTPERFMKLAGEQGFSRSSSIMPRDLTICADINHEVPMRSGKKDNIIFAVLESAFANNAYAHVSIIKAIVRNKKFSPNLVNKEGLGVLDLMAIYDPAQSAHNEIELENNKTFKEDVAKIFMDAGANPQRRRKYKGETLTDPATGQARSVIVVYSNYQLAMLKAEDGKAKTAKQRYSAQGMK